VASLVVALLVAALAVAPASAQRVVTDPNTGLAIYGYDPIAYFLDRAPLRGNPAHELTWRGATWRFASAANRAAFFAAPEIYAPRYAGHDALAAAAGVATAGDPLIFVVHDGELYFFRSAQNRAQWLADPAAYVAAADAAWPAIVARMPG
jgi:YHS domain-containing protein